MVYIIGFQKLSAKLYFTNTKDSNKMHPKLESSSFSQKSIFKFVVGQPFQNFIYKWGKQNMFERQLINDHSLKGNASTTIIQKIYNKNKKVCDSKIYPKGAILLLG